MSDISWKLAVYWIIKLACCYGEGYSDKKYHTKEVYLQSLEELTLNKGGSDTWNQTKPHGMHNDLNFETKMCVLSCNNLY